MEAVVKITTIECVWWFRTIYASILPMGVLVNKREGTGCNEFR